MVMLSRKAMMGSRDGGAGKMVTLPQFLAPDGVTMFDDFEGERVWVAYNSLGTVEEDATNVFSGEKSLKLTSRVGNFGQFISMPFVSSFDFSQAQYFRLRYFVHSGDLPISFQVTLFQGSNYYTTQPQPSTSAFEVGKWNTLILSRANFTKSTPAPDWSKPFTRVEIRVNVAAEKQASLSIDTMEWMPSLTPAALITFDDGRVKSWDGLDYMRSKGVRGTLYIITERPGQEGHLTVEQLQELDEAGFDIGNHTHEHTDLKSTDEAGVAAALTTAKNTLDGWGLTRASGHVAYPFGLYDDTVLSVMGSQGLPTGRTTNYIIQGTVPMANWHQVPSVDIDYDSSLASVQTHITQRVAAGRVPVLLFHRFTSGTPGAGEWHIDDFKALIDWLVDQHIYPLTISELYGLQSGPVTVPQPW